MVRFRYFPVSYAVAGRRVVVVGEGDAALQKLRLLVRTEAVLTLLAAAPSPALSAFAAAQGVAHREEDFCACALDDVALAFVATGDADADARCAAHAQARGVPVNVVDRPHLSDFATPAIVDRAPISIAIATDGHAPVLATRLRGMIEALLPPALGRLGELAAQVRERVLGRLGDPVIRRRFWAGLIEGRPADLALAGDVAAAATLALAGLDEAADARPAGRVFVVGAGPGASDLLTLRAHRLLLAADALAFDDGVPEAILAMGRRDAERFRLDPHARGTTTALLARLAGDGKRVVRLVAGDARSGAARAEIAVLRAAGIDCEHVPGVAPAAVAADSLRPARRRAA